MQQISPVLPTPDDDWPAPRYAWTTLALLMIAMIVSSCDRTVMLLLIEPINAHYGLSDTQFGALQGLAFGTFYVVAAIPLGILADRFPRRLIIGCGVGMFSCFSLMTGLARNYTQLFAARMGVGFGEASLSPAGYSLISDYFPPDRVGRAISMFSMCSFAGASIALAGGGLVVGWFEAQALVSPSGLVFGLAPWQATILAMALPGVLLTPLLLLIREPRRRGLIAGKARLGFSELLEEIGKRRLFIILITLSMAMANVMSGAASTWAPTLFIRIYGWTATEIGVALGALTFVSAISGSYLAGWAVDWLTRRNTLDGPLKLAGYSFLLAGVFGVAAPLMPSGELALAVMAPMLFLKPMCFACAPIALQIAIPNQIRAQVTAGYLTVLNIVGLAIGPIVVGAITDHIFSGPNDLRYSISVVVAITVPIMVTCMLRARRPFRQIRSMQG